MATKTETTPRFDKERIGSTLRTIGRYALAWSGIGTYAVLMYITAWMVIEVWAFSKPLELLFMSAVGFPFAIGAAYVVTLPLEGDHSVEDIYTAAGASTILWIVYVSAELAFWGL